MTSLSTYRSITRPSRAIVSCAILLASTVTHAAPWQPLGPAPIVNGPFTGRCSAVTASPTDRGLYYVAAASGGVWRSRDGGLTWTPLTDDMPAAAIGSLVMDPNDESIIYAGTGEANFANHSLYGLGVYKSTDGGNSWTILAEGTFAGRTFSKLIISHADSQTLYASIMHAGGFPARNAAKGHPLMDGPVGVFRSTDAGVTWTHLTNGLPAVAASDVAIDPVDADILYAAIGDIFGTPDNGVYKSIDGGDTWVKQAGGLPTGTVGRISLAVAPSRPQRVYALITNPTDATGGGAETMDLYKTDNGGGRWIPTNVGGLLQATYGWYLSTVAVHPLDPDKFYAGGLDLVRSTSGGDHYVDVTPPHVDMHGLAFDAIGRLLCADDGGLHRSADNGNSWYALNEGLGAIQFYPGLSLHPTNRDFVLGGTQDNGTNRRESGWDWSHRLGGDGGYTALHPATPNYMFAEHQGTGNLYRSTNGGGNFFAASAGINPSDRNCFLPPMTYAPDNPNTVYYGTHRVYRSTNGGTAWTPISDDLTGGAPAAIRALVVAPSNGQTLYAATNDGRVLVSTDGGVDWNLTLEGIPGWPRVTRELAVDPRHDGTALLAVSQFGVDQVRITTDYGQTWTGIDGDLPDVPANTAAIHNDGRQRLLFVGTDRGVYVSCNDGANWRKMGTELPNTPVNDLIVDTRFDRLVAGTLGRGAWEINLPGSADADGDGDIDLADVARFQACRTAPRNNPGHVPPMSDCWIDFDLDYDNDIDLRDYQCLGDRLDGPQ